MRDAFRTSIVMLGLLTLTTGVAYPLAVVAIARAAFPTQASGSLVLRGDKPIGSSLIGQPFADPGYFWGRPSATSPAPYNPSASGGSNLGPLNPALRDAVRGRVDAIRRAGPTPAPVPIDLATASGSGLDPHVSPAAAEVQVARVARARGKSEEEVRAILSSHVEGRQLGLLGEPRVNVLLLNLALDEASARP